jgi:nitrogen fixation protein
MALKFGDSAGGAQKNRADAFEPKVGENRVRMFGNLVARYVYWIKGENNKPLPFECLEFDRETEKFGGTNEKDWVKEYYPDIKCGWAYAILVIDPADGKVKIWNLKKKLTESIISLAKDPELGDPTDLESGWDIVFEKKKTGPLPINVGYELMQRKLKQRPLTEEELALVKESKTIEEMLPRPTSDQQKELLEKLRNGGGGENIDEDVGTEFEVK